MGASTFEDYGYGKTPEQAFNSAVADAQYENGHGGYTGTLAEKHDFVVIPVPSEWKGKEEQYAYHLIDKSDSRINDKWGPAGCILVESSDAVDHVAYATTAERYKQEGARQWKTVYVVTSHGNQAGLRREVDSQTEAEAIAKELSKTHNATVTISIEKKLVNGDKKIITIRPKTKEVKSKLTNNKYLFFGWASC